MEGLFATLTNVNFDNAALQDLIEKTEKEKNRLVPECLTCESSCGKNNDYDMNQLWNADEDIRSLKSLILFTVFSIKLCFPSVWTTGEWKSCCRSFWKLVKSI